MAGRTVLVISPMRASRAEIGKLPCPPPNAGRDDEGLWNSALIPEPKPDLAPELPD
jgi:hypothetical protein